MRHKTFKLRLIVSKIVQKVNHPTYVGFSIKDENRFFVLWVWSERYKVPLSYTIESLLKIWGLITGKHKRGRKPMLGVSPAIFTGKKSEQFLQECILRDYPNRENESEWRLKQQEKLLGLEDEPRGKAQSFIDIRHPENMVRSYKRKVDRRARKLAKANAAEWRKGRAWRGNPWTR